MLFATLLVSAVALFQPDGWKDCPNGTQMRIAQECAVVGPHPTSLYFDQNSAALTPRSLSSLNGFAIHMRLIHAEVGPDLVHVIEAHTDVSESDEDDLSLSRRRAQSVRQFLTSNGLPAGSLHIMLAGDARPTDTSIEANNRRVVIYSRRR